MTDLEISTALALAIGWLAAYTDGEVVYLDMGGVLPHRVFDYRDWNVIGPIAEKYNAFPRQQWDGSWTPNKASQLADAAARQ